MVKLQSTLEPRYKELQHDVPRYAARISNGIPQEMLRQKTLKECTSHKKFSTRCVVIVSSKLSSRVAFYFLTTYISLEFGCQEMENVAARLRLQRHRMLRQRTKLKGRRTTSPNKQRDKSIWKFDNIVGVVSHSSRMTLLYEMEKFLQFLLRKYEGQLWTYLKKFVFAS